jgi:hypothetical protein
VPLVKLGTKALEKLELANIEVGYFEHLFSHKSKNKRDKKVI